jgi:hypothetical protein
LEGRQLLVDGWRKVRIKSFRNHFLAGGSEQVKSFFGHHS